MTRFSVRPSHAAGWWVVTDNDLTVAVTARGGKAIRPTRAEAEVICERLERQAAREARKQTVSS